MKIRDGFVTNSSSTNFLIISKEDLTVEYLCKQLGFKKGSPIEESGRLLCQNIIEGCEAGVRWFNYDEITYEVVREIFGEKSAERFKKLDKQGYKSYMGHTSSDEDYLTIFFTIDHFIIDNKDIYIDGQNCVW